MGRSFYRPPSPDAVVPRFLRNYVDTTGEFTGWKSGYQRDPWKGFTYRNPTVTGASRDAVDAMLRNANRVSGNMRGNAQATIRGLVRSSGASGITRQFGASRVAAFNQGFARTALKSPAVWGAQMFRRPPPPRGTGLWTVPGPRGAIPRLSLIGPGRRTMTTAQATSFAGMSAAITPYAFAMLWRALWDNLMRRLLDEFYEFSCGGADGMFTSRRSPDCGEESIWGLSGPTPPIYPYTIGSVANGFYQPVGIAQIRGVITGQWTRPAASPSLPQSFNKGISDVLDGNAVGTALPWLDPLVVPFSDFGNRSAKIPIWALPSRARNPYRARTESWSAGYDAETLESVGENLYQPRSSRSEKIKVDAGGGAKTPGIVDAPTDGPVKPGDGVKERKTKIERAFAAFLKAYGAYTEMVDVVKAMYNALPGRLRYKLRMENGGKTLNAVQKLQAVLAYSRGLGREEFAAFMVKGLVNVAVSQAKDIMIGKLMKPMDDFIRMAIPAYGERMLVRMLVKAAYKAAKE